MKHKNDDGQSKAMLSEVYAAGGWPCPGMVCKTPCVVENEEVLNNIQMPNFVNTASN